MDQFRFVLIAEFPTRIHHDRVPLISLETLVVCFGHMQLRLTDTMFELLDIGSLQQNYGLNRLLVDMIDSNSGKYV